MALTGGVGVGILVHGGERIDVKEKGISSFI